MAATKQDRDIRAQLKSIGSYAGRLGSSAARLFLASGKEMVSITMPTLVDTFDVNKEVIDATVRFLRNPADSINRGVQRGMETDTYKELIKFGKNALDDLKSGNLYDADRDRSDVNAEIDDMLSDFGGFDMTGFDENGDWSDSDSEVSSDLLGQAKIADIQEENASKRTEATIGAIGSSTEAITSTIAANSQANIRVSMKQHSQLMNTLNNSLSIQTAQLKAVSDSMSAAMEVARESHNQIMSQMQTMTGLLTEIRDGVAPKANEKQYKEPNQVFGPSGSLNIRNYIKQVIGNVNETFGIGSSVSMMTAGMSPKELIQLVQDNPWQLVSGLILDQIVPKRLKEQMSRTDTNLKNFFPALLDKLAQRGQRRNAAGEQSLSDLIAGLFGVRQRSRTSIETNIEDFNKQVPFTRKTATAIEVVIPSLLSQINSSISGQPMMTFDYKAGKFRRTRDVIAETYHSAHDLVGSMSTANKIINMGGEYNFKTTEEREKFQNYLYRFFQERASDSKSGFINPNMKKEDFMETMPDSSKKELYYSLLMGLLNSMERSDLMSLSQEMFSARSDRDKRNFNINNELRENGLIAAFSELGLDSSGMWNLEKASMKSRFALSANEVDGVVDKRKQELIRQGGVKASNILLNEILKTLRTGILTYNIGNSNVEGTDASTIVAAILKQRTSTIDQESIIKQNIYRETNYKKQLKEEELAKARNAQGPMPLDEILIDSDISPEMATMAMMAKQIQRMDPKKSDNPAVRFMGEMNQKLSGAASDVLNKTGVTSIWDKVRKMTESPFSFMEQALKTMDAFMFKMLYGEDAALQLENGGEPSLMRSVVQAVKTQFLDAKDWFRANIGDPIRNSLFDKEKGLFPRLGRTIKENLIDPITQPFKDRINETKDRIKKRYIGTLDEESGQYKGGKFSDKINRAKGAISPGGAVENKVLGAVSRFLYGDLADTKGKRVTENLEYEEDPTSIEELYSMKKTRKVEYGGAIGKLRKGFDSVNKFLFGDDFDASDDEKSENAKSRMRFKEVTNTLKQSAPGMAKGAGLGLLASFFLPGGPLLGTMFGAFAGLAGGTNDFAKYLLGDFAEEPVTDNEGNVIHNKDGTVKMRKKRQGGIIGKDVADGFQRFIPGVSKGAVIGSIAGGLGLLPFGLGSTAGMVIGSIAGMSATSDTIKKLIFGDAEDPKSGMISKEFREKVKKQVKEAAGPALGGAALGAGAWSAISGLGIIPGLSLLPGGPVFALLGGITAAANADRIKKFFFGEEGEETVEEPVYDNDGKQVGTKKVTRKKRQGGVFNKVVDTIDNKFMKPLGERVTKVGESIQDWFKESITTPLKNAMKPAQEKIQEAFHNIGNSLKNVGQSILDGIGKAIGVSFNGDDGKGGLHAFIQDKIVKRLDNFVSKIFGGIGKAIGAVISAPFKLAEAIFSPETYRASRDKRKQERLQRRDERRQKRRQRRREKNAERQKKRFGEIGGLWGKLFKRFMPNMDNVEGDETPNDIVADTVADLTGGSSEEHEESQAVRDYKERKQKEREESTISDSDAMRATRKAMDRRMRKERKDNDKETRKKLNEAKNQIEKAEREARKAKEKNEKDANKAKAAQDESAEGKKRTGKKTNNEYLERIWKKLRDIHDEIKGQVNGVGWNTAYIKTLLEKQFGKTLSDDELPEEMEGSRKGIAKRRGFFGRLKDKAKNFVGGARDRVTDFFDSVKEKFGDFFEPIRQVFEFVGNVKKGLGNGIRGLWGGAKKAAGGLWKGAKAVGRGARNAAGFLGDLILDLGDFIAGIGPAIGSGLKTVFDTVGGVMKDFVLAASGTVRGLIQTAAEIAPEIAAGVMDFLRGAGSVAWRGIKAVGRGIRNKAHALKEGAAGLFRKIFHRGDKDDADDGKGGKRKKGKGGLRLEGGFLNEIKEPVRIEIGPKAHPTNFPWVSVLRGKASGKRTNIAIPVYIVGADEAARLHVINVNENKSGDAPENPADKIKAPGADGKIIETNQDSFKVNTGTPVSGDNTGAQLKAQAAAKAAAAKEEKQKLTARQRVFKRLYRRINKASETATSETVGDVYDRAVSQATSMDEIEAIKTVEQLNGSGQAAAIADATGAQGEEKKDGFLSNLLSMLGLSGPGLLKKGLGFLGKAAPYLASGAAILYGATHEGEGHMVTRGAEGITQTLLRRSGLGSLTGNELITGVKNIASDPTYLLRYSDEVAKVAADETVDAATRKAAKSGMKSLSRAFSAFDFVDMVRNPANAKAAMELGKEAGIRKGAGMWLKGAGATAVNKVGGLYKKAFSEAGEVIGKSAGNAVNSFKTKASQLLKGALDKFFNNKTVKTLAGKLASKFGPIKEKIVKTLTGTAFDKAAKMAGTETLEKGLRSILGLSTAGIATAAFAVVDFITGFNSAGKIFNVHASQVTLGMKLTAAIYRALSGIISVIPVVGTVLSVALSFAEDPLVQAIYGLVAGDAAKEELAQNQQQVAAAAEEAGMSVDEYTKMYDENGNPKKKGIFGTIASAVGSVVKGITGTIGNFFGGIFGGNQNNEETGAGRGFWGTGPVTPMSQTAGKWNKHGNRNMALAGCGPTVASMIGSAYGDKRSPMVANRMSYGMGMRAADGGMNPAFFSQYANTYGTGGYRMQEGPVNNRMIASNLAKQQPVALMGKGGPFGNHMHYMVADAIDKRGNASFVDPMSGARKNGRLNNLTKNTHNAIYSWGTGSIDMMDERKAANEGQEINGRQNADGTRSYKASEVQQQLVDQMRSIYGQIPYSLEGPQDPDKGSASCASTVGWAYRKVLGIDGMSASSSAQSQDSRFSTIWVNDGTPLDTSILQPGDIIYQNWNQTRYNPNLAKPMSHTEMYAGDNTDLSHGGDPHYGPVEKSLNDYRKKHTMMVRRYTPFTDPDAVVKLDAASTKKASGSSSGGALGAIAGVAGTVGEFIKNTAGTLGGIFAGSMADQLLSAGFGLNMFTNLAGNALTNLLSPIFGGGTDESEVNTDGTSESKNSQASKSESGSSTSFGSNTTGSASSISQTDQAKQIWRYLTKTAGLKKPAAAGIMGCWQSESGNRADRVEGDYLKSFPGFDKVMESTDSMNDYVKNILFPIYDRDGVSYNPNGYLYNGNYFPGIGLAQWTASRGAGLLNYAKNNKGDWRTLDTQLGFANYEMSKSGLKMDLNKLNTPEEAADMVLDRYEMNSEGFAQRSPEHSVPRRANARSIYDTYSAQDETGAGRGLRGVWGTGLKDLLGDKYKRATTPFSYGTGTKDANVSALNAQVRRINNLIANTREEAATDPVTNAVTKLQQTMVSGSDTDSKTNEILSAIATSISTMVQLLTDIKSNTEPTKEHGVSSGQGSDKGSKYANLPAAENGIMPGNYTDRSYKTGAEIINVLTSK